MGLLCVPFNSAWAGSEAKNDLRAIYRRRKQDNWGTPILDADGLEQWDTTGPLPLRRHHQYAAKGFEYLTLADEESLRLVAGELDRPWTDYIQDRRTRSPFSAEKYYEDAKQAKAAELSELIALVKEFGADAVTKIKRQAAKDWQMPASVLEAVTAPDPAPVSTKKDKAA